MDKSNKNDKLNDAPALTVSGKLFQPIDNTELADTIIDRFEKMVFAFPKKIAIKDESNSLNYLQLHAHVCNLADQIRASANPGFPIGIAIENNAYFPIAMLAALATGFPYVPLDLNNPAERNKLIINHSSIRTVIVQHTIAELPEYISQIKIVHSIEQRHEPAKIDQVRNGNKIAYIIYTSGSSGIPKGVFQNQKNLLHDVLQYVHSIELKHTDRLSMLYSPSVGGAIRDIFGALLTGASLHIYPIRKFGIMHLSKFLCEEKITVYHSIPAIFRTFLKLDFDKNSLENIRIIYLAGDRIFKSDIELYKKYFPDHSVVYIGIGATEVATIYHQWFINKNTPCPHETIPVGFSIPDKKTEIIREDGTIATKGETGEIKITSKYISLGYWNEPSLTNSQFSADEENRSYYTGDLGRINEDGMLEFIGRRDTLVKINGNRIELSEIEAFTMKIPSISNCVSLLYSKRDIRLIALFFVSSHKNSEKSVSAQLRSWLPEYMIPRLIIQLEEIPLLANFKNDNHSLQKYLENHLLTTDEYSGQPAEKSLREQIRSVWTSFLGNESFESNLSWKDAGGDSISLVHMIVQLELNLGIKIHNNWINGNLLPQELINHLAKEKSTDNKKRLPKLYYFPPIYGMSNNGIKLMQELSDNFNITIIKYPDWDAINRREITVEEISKQLIQQIPDYNTPSISYLGNCQGVNFMHALFKNFPIEHYGFVGVIDGINNIVPAQEKPFAYQFVQNLNWTYASPKKYIKLFKNLEQYIKSFYFTNSFFRKTKNYWIFFLSGFISNRSMIEMIYFDFGTTFFSDLPYIEFCSEDNILFKTPDLQKENQIKKSIIKLNGTHHDLLNDENRITIKNYLLSQIQE